MRKKLFAILMSAMMMVTFMPAMAFADATLGWNADKTAYTYQYDEGGVTKTATSYNVQKYVVATTVNSSNEGTWSDGKVYIAAFGNDDVLIQGSQLALGYDLNSAVARKIGDEKWYDAQSKFTATEASTMFGNGTMAQVTELEFNVPSYVTKVWSNSGNRWYKATKVEMQPKTLDTPAGGDATFKITTPKRDTDKVNEDQEFTLYVSSYFANATEAAKFIGDVPARKMTIVKDAAKTIANVAYTFDGKATTVEAAYDGAEHKLTQIAIDGVTSTYQMLNEKLGKYEDVTGDVVVKNAGTYHVIATAKDAKNVTKKTYIDIKVSQAGEASVKFKEDKFNVGGEYDAKAYLVAYAKNATNSYDVAAVKADKATILEYFNAMYNVVVENGTATIVAKTAAETKGVAAKYAELLGNYSKVCDSVTGSATFKMINDVTFTEAPLTKTYKYKNLKKKAKTFTVKAEAASGAALVYKVKGGAGKVVINRTTGEVTVKKGLKKGTYKIDVYAITVDSFNGGAALQTEDHYTLKIKVK